MKTVKCISIKNPLSYLVCAGIKDIENRSWQTKHRGWIYIHSCGGLDYPFITVKDFPEQFHGEVNEVTAPYSAAIIDLDRKIKSFYGTARDNPAKIKKAIEKKGCYFRSGCIVGRVRIHDIVRDSNSPFAQKGFYHWILKDAELFEKPIENILGRQSIFTINI
jgi:hypothetical protein